MGAERIEAWNWQCWRKFKTKPDEWVGFFNSEKDALAWVKTQPGEFVINNVPPAGRNSQGRVTSEKTVAAGEWKTFKDVPASRPSRPVVAPQPKVVKPRKALTPEEIALRDDAQKVYDQHKADEAAELAAESE